MNVRSAPFNAKGDGTSDDTAAIAAALRAGAGATVEFPPGRYAHNAPLTPASGTTLLGRGAVLIGGAHPRGELDARGRQLDLFAAHGVTVTGFAFESPLAPFRLSSSERATIRVGGRSNAIVGNTWNGVPVTAVLCKSARDTVIADNTCHGSGIVYAYYGTSRTLVVDNMIVDAPGNGLTSVGNRAAVPNDGCRIERNTILRSGRFGIEEHGTSGRCTNSIFSDNTVIDSAGTGISAVGEASRLSGNVIRDAGHYAAIETVDADTTVQGNKISFTREPGRASGIIVDRLGAHGGAILRANSVVGASTAVQVANHPRGLVVVGNLISDWTHRGIVCERGLVRSNHLEQHRLGATSARYGLLVGADSRIEDNVIKYVDTDGPERAIKIMSRTSGAVFVNNRIDGGGRPVAVTAGGASVFKIVFDGNLLVHGAFLDQRGVALARAPRDARSMVRTPRP